MARKAGVVLVADSVAFQRGMEQAAGSAQLLDDELKKLGVDATASAEAQVKATQSRIARLQQEAGAARLAAGSYAAGSAERDAAISLEQRKLASLARLQGEAGLSASESARLQVSSTMSQVEALDVEIATYRELGVAAAGSAREQQVASRLANEAQARQAGLLGITPALRGSRSEALGRVGRGLTTFVAAPAAFVGYEAVKGAVDFNQQMLLLQTQAGASAAEVRELNGQVLNLARIAPQGPIELSKGLFHLISLGVPAAHSMGVLKTASLAAGMGVADLEDTTTALGAAVVSGIGGAQNYNRAMSTLVATAGSGNMRFADLASSVGNILAPAKSAGIDLRELGAAMAVLTDRGMDAHEAATRLRMTFLQMAAPSEPAKKALKDMGIDADSLGVMLRQPNGLLNVLQLLHDRVEAVGKVRGNRDLAEAFGRGRGSLGILTLVQSLDSPLSSYGSKLNQISKLEQRYARNQHDYMESPAYKLHAAWSTIQADLIRLGATLTPVATHIANDFAKVAEAINALPHFVKRDIGIIVGILGVGGPLLLAGVRVAKMVREIRTAFLGLRTTMILTEGTMGGLATGAAALAGPFLIAAAAVYGLDKALAKLTGFDALSKAWGSAGFGADDTAHDVVKGKNPYAMGTSLHTTWEHGFQGKPETDAEKRSSIANKAYQQGRRAHPLHKDHGGGNTNVDTSTAGAARSAGGRHHDRDFALPYDLQLEQARAQTTKSTADDKKALRDIIAYAKKQIDSGKLGHKALLEALQQEGSAMSELQSLQTRQAKDVAKKAKDAGQFSLSKSLQLAQARADAIAAGIPNLDGPTKLQIKLAREEKAAALKAIRSGHLTFQGMIDAWNAVAQANSVLAQQAKSKSKNQIDTYHAVSSKALTDGMNLTKAQRTALEERLAQRSAHRGYAPNYQGATDSGMNFGDVYVYGVKDVDGFRYELEKRRRHHHQRAGARR